MVRVPSDSFESVFFFFLNRVNKCQPGKCKVSLETYTRNILPGQRKNDIILVHIGDKIHLYQHSHYMLQSARDLFRFYLNYNNIILMSI